MRLSPGEHTLTFTVQDREGARNSASARVHSGAIGEADLEIALKLENAAEQLLASDRIIDWQPFGTRVLETVYVAPGASHYTLRAAVDDALLFDPNPAIDSRSWTFSNQPPVASPARFDLTPTSPLDLQLSGFDPDGDPLTFRIVTGPTLGVLEHPGDAWRYLGRATAGYSWERRYPWLGTRSKSRWRVCRRSWSRCRIR